APAHGCPSCADPIRQGGSAGRGRADRLATRHRRREIHVFAARPVKSPLQGPGAAASRLCRFPLSALGERWSVMSWDYVFVQVTNGAVIGVIYALIAAGVPLLFSILKILNFAHGGVYMLGGYCAYYIITLLSAPPLLAMLAAMAALFALAIVLERLLLLPLYSATTERKDEYGLIVTFGLAFFLRNIAVILFGPFPLKPPSFIPGVQRVGNLVLTNDRLFAGGVGILLIAALLYFLQRTIWGQALDAVSQSRESAAIVGINAQRFNSIAFGTGAALAAGAGA